MCQQRNTTAPATATSTSQCNGCKRKALGQCPALRSTDKSLLPVINNLSAAPSAATAIDTSASTFAATTEPVDAQNPSQPQ